MPRFEVIHHLTKTYFVTIPFSRGSFREAQRLAKAMNAAGRVGQFDVREAGR